MKSFYFILCNAVLFCWVAPVLAANENPFFARSWLAEDGLPDNRVVGLAQSTDGYLWVATQGGVVRFDGVRFQRVGFPRFPSLVAGTLRALMLDRKGRVWLAKEEGGILFCFDGREVRMLTGEAGLPRNEAQRSMALDARDDLWVTYSTGKVIRYGQDGKVNSFAAKDGLPAEGVCWLANDRGGTLWFAKGSHVGVCRDGRFNVLENFGSPAVRIAPARSGGIWICAGQQILKFDEGTEKVELGEIMPDETSNRSSLEPSVLLEDREGALWVGTVSAGLFRCDSNTVTRVEVSNPAILSLTEDREGNMWVGTRGGGLNRVHRRLASIIKSSDGLPFQGVQSVCQDATGELWLVGDNGGLVRGQGTNWTVQTPSVGMVKAHATCVAAATNGLVWVGAWGGALYQWAGGQFNDLGSQASLDQKSPRSLLVMKNGDLWIGTDSPTNLYRLSREKLQKFDLPAGFRFVRAMAEDAAGNFWAGASDGLLVRVTGDVFADETTSSSSLSIRCLHGAANGDLWIGYASAGVGRLRNGSITRFSTDQGLPNDYIAQILTDNRDSVWFAGNQGIFQVRERDFDDLANGLASRVWPVVYGRNEGLPGLQASFDFCPDSLRASGDRLYFSMLSGLAEVQLDYARLNYRPPSVFIERVAADGRTLAAYQDFNLESPTNATARSQASSPEGKGELRLPPGLEQVQFEFTALSFVAPENVQFRYQLEGLDKNWVDAGTRRVASYTHPPPGRYVFKVIACNNDGIWNRTGDTLTVTFEPFFWETLWFKSAVAASSCVALCGIVVQVLRRRHRLVVERLEQQRAMELERNRIARDLHDDLGVGLTEIGLLGDLAGANGELPPPGRDHVQEIASRARALAASLDEIVWAVNPANDTSQSLVDYFFPFAQKLLGHAGIRCRLEVIEPLPAGNLNAEERHEFFHAYKEALNNIIRHSGATQVEITISAKDGSLLVRVFDNGCGLEEATDKGAHHGLAGMRERLLRLKGRCDVASNPSKGTTVTFIVPVQPEKSR